MSIWVMLLLIFFIQGFLHYASRRELWGKELPRPLAYTLGTLGIMAPYTAWLWGDGQIDRFEAISVLWVTIATGGGTVVLAYLVDWGYKTVVSLSETKAREAEVTEILQNRAD